MDARSKGSDVRRVQSGGLQEGFKALKFHQLPKIDILNPNPLFALSLHRRPTRRISDAGDIGANWNLPNPVEVFRPAGVEVQRRALDRLRNCEIGPNGHLRGPVLNSVKLEFASQKACCESRCINEPGRRKPRPASGVDRGYLLSVRFNPYDSVLD